MNIFYRFFGTSLFHLNLGALRLLTTRWPHRIQAFQSAATVCLVGDTRREAERRWRTCQR